MRTRIGTQLKRTIEVYALIISVTSIFVLILFDAARNTTESTIAHGLATLVENVISILSVVTAASIMLAIAMWMYRRMEE